MNEKRGVIMNLRNEDEIEQYQSINYFVRQKLSSGDEMMDNELWAKEWLEEYVKNNKKIKINERYYNAYHAIPKSVEIWQERMNLKRTELKKQSKAKKKVLAYKFKDRAKELLEINRYKTLIDFDNLQPEEYKMIVNWLEKGKDLPEYLQGIMKYKPTFKEKAEKILGSGIEETLKKGQNYVFYLFIAFFFTMLMLLNL